MNLIFKQKWKIAMSLKELLKEKRAAHSIFIQNSSYPSTILNVYWDNKPKDFLGVTITENLYITTEKLPLRIFEQLEILERDALDVLEYILIRCQSFHNVKLIKNGGYAALEYAYDPFSCWFRDHLDGYIFDFYRNPIKPDSLFSCSGKCALKNIGDRNFLERYLPKEISSKMNECLIKWRFYRVVESYTTTFKLNVGKPIDSEIEIVIELNSSTMEEFLERVKELLGHRQSEIFWASNYGKPLKIFAFPEYREMGLETFRETINPIFIKARESIIGRQFKKFPLETTQI